MRPATKHERDRASAVTVDTFGRMVGVGRTQAYELIQQGKVHHIRVGRRILIPLASVLRFLDVEPPNTPNGGPAQIPDIPGK